MVEFVSLGSDCSVAYQLNLHKLRTSAYPFDWVRCNDFNTTVDCIENNFEHFFDQTDLRSIPSNGTHPYMRDDQFDINRHGLRVVNKKNNIRFYHDFLHNLTEEYDDVRKKYDRRIKRFFETLEGKKRIVFVRVERSEIPEKTIGRFDSVIRRYTNNYSLCVVVLKKYKNIQFKSWTKDEIDWNSIFQIQQISNPT
jgi:hypothetical protein